MFFSYRKDTRKSLVVVAAQTHAYFRHPKNEIVDVSTYALDVVVKLSNKEAAIDDADVTRHRTDPCGNSSAFEVSRAPFDQIQEKTLLLF